MNTCFYVSHKNMVISIIVYDLCGFHGVVPEYT